MILEHCSRASCVQIIDALRDRVAELTAVLEERDDMILSQAEGLAALTKERELCAEVCENLRVQHGNGDPDGDECAAAIRSMK